MKSFKQFLHESSDQPQPQRCRNCKPGTMEPAPPDPILTDLEKKGKINTSTREILSAFPGYNQAYFDTMKKAQTDPKYADVLKKYNIPDWNEIDTPLTVRPMNADDEHTMATPLGLVDPDKDPHTIAIKNDKNLLKYYREPARHVLAHESSHTAKAQQPGWFKNTSKRVMPVQPVENEILDRVKNDSASLHDIQALQHLNYFGNPNEVPAHARAYKTKYAEKTGTPWMPGDRQDPAKWKIMRDDIIGNSTPLDRIKGEFFGSEEGEKVMDLARRNEQKRTPQAVAEAWAAKARKS